MMNENIKIGGDIHAGDGGYSIGTKEKYDEFVKGRNQSLGKMRIDKLLVAAGAYFGGEGVVYDTFDPKMFAELIVKECANAIVNDSRLSDVRTARNGCVRTIKEHFGVEE
jgi:hypothetical protein